MLTGVFSHMCLSLSPMSHASFKIASFTAALGQRSSSFLNSICCSDFLTRTASLATAELPVVWQWQWVTASGDSECLTVTGCVVGRRTGGCFCCWLTPGFPFLKQMCYEKCLRRISMIKVCLLWRLVRNIFSAKPIFGSILVVLELDEILSLFSLFTWTFFLCFLPLPLQLYHACRSACCKHILKYIYPECVLHSSVLLPVWNTCVHIGMYSNAYLNVCRP